MSGYDAIVVGETADFGSYEFTAERIKAWAVKWDPQPFHVDEAAAAKSIYGGLIASGWHTCAVLMRLQVDHFQAARSGEAATGTQERSRARAGAPLRFGPSPGFNDLKWIKPVYAGDTIACSGRVTDKRLSQSRPGTAIVTTLFTAINQKGETVLTMTAHVFVMVG
jgi:acyl dehydratase